MFDCTIEDNFVIFSFQNGKTNSINQETLQGLEKMIDRVNREYELKGIILTGSGKYFSSGFELETFTSFASDQAIIDWFRMEEEAMLKLFTCSKPVVAAVNGHATAAGMIVSMACDCRMVVNNPRIKMGMTEIKIGLSLTPAESEIMVFGLDTDKNFRDVVFGGELFTPADAVNKGIFDELVETAEDLIPKAKAKVSALIDTPNRPFVRLKQMQRQDAAASIRAKIDAYDMNNLVQTFTHSEVLNILNMVKKSLGG